MLGRGRCEGTVGRGRAGLEMARVGRGQVGLEMGCGGLHTQGSWGMGFQSDSYTLKPFFFFSDDDVSLDCA